jgi:hypothetical protein
VADVYTCPFARVLVSITTGGPHEFLGPSRSRRSLHALGLKAHWCDCPAALARPSIYAAKRLCWGPGEERRDPTKQFYIKLFFSNTVILASIQSQFRLHNFIRRRGVDPKITREDCGSRMRRWTRRCSRRTLSSGRRRSRQSIECMRVCTRPPGETGGRVPAPPE